MIIEKIKTMSNSVFSLGFFVFMQELSKENRVGVLVCTSRSKDCLMEVKSCGSSMLFCLVTESYLSEQTPATSLLNDMPISLTIADLVDLFFLTHWAANEE